MSAAEFPPGNMESGPSPLQLCRLMQLSSAALPVGAFSYSGGLESAQAAGWLPTPRAVGEWVLGLGEHSLASFELPLLLRLHAACAAGDSARVDQLCEWLEAGRETRELRDQDAALGRTALKLLGALGVPGISAYATHSQPNFLLAFALAGVGWGLQPRDVLVGYSFSWAENQLQAALKLSALGHTDAQRLLSQAGSAIPRWVQRAEALKDHELGSAAPGLGIASAQHEQQYSRLFRS